MKDLILGIDVGTTTIKTVAFHLDGSVAALERQNNRVLTTCTGSVLQNMDELWRDVASTIRLVCTKVQNIGEIIGVGITAQGDGLWMLDENGKPVTEAVIWTDSRATNYIEKWKTEGILGKSGRQVFSGSPLSISAWFNDHSKEDLENAKYIIFCKDWIKYCLTGNVVTDYSDLSDASLINTLERVADKNLLDQFIPFDFYSKIPTVTESTDIIGSVHETASESTGLKTGTPVINGMIDVVANSIGAGVINSGDACSIVGTTVYNEIVVNWPLELSENETVSVVSHADPGKRLLTMGTMQGTPNLDWFLEKLLDDRFGFAEVEEKLLNIPAGSNGIIYHPYLGNGGERAPFINSAATASLFGLNITHDKWTVLNSVYEGIALSLKDCYMNMPIMPQKVSIAGGGSNSKYWCQMFSDCLGLPIELTTCSELGALGAAIAVSIGLNIYKSYEEGIDKMVRLKHVFYPTKSKNASLSRIVFFV